MPAFCPNCWKELPSGKEICPVCGQKVTLGPYTGKYRPWTYYWDMQFNAVVVGLIMALIAVVILIAVFWLHLL